MHHSRAQLQQQQRVTAATKLKQEVADNPSLKMRNTVANQKIVG
jgi:hypothetical protein